MRLAKIPRFPLTTTPTPLVRAQNLEAALGPEAPRIFLKRDDLTGLAFGGNKARKLEYLVADALAKGATTLITEGAVQSNHARMTAAAAVIAGMRATLVLDARHGDEVAGNLLLDHLMGADVRVMPDNRIRRAEVERIADEIRAAGDSPYLIPTGGSVPIGAAGYVAMVPELLTQLQAIGEAPTRIYFATSSLGTQAGLAVGARASSAPFDVRGIAVEGTKHELATAASVLATETADLVGLDSAFTEADLIVDDRFVGPGYGVPTEGGLVAIRLLAQTEAVFLDPVYTGKAMDGLLTHIRTGQIGQEESVIFLHTGGGPSLFAHGTRLLA